MSHTGVLNVNKPSGMTSRRAVDIVQRLARPAKVGHAGTLDPLATGVLVVCVGAATRLIEYVQQMPKRYRATFLLGRQSPTEDIEGGVTELPGAPVPTTEAIAAAAQRFVGRIEQRPPAFSALKVGGRRAYQLARQGETPQLAPRPIDIFSINVESYEYPKLVIEVACGSGTYIRSLGRDLAESLDTGAVMSALERTAIGRFRIEDAVDPATLTADRWASLLQPPIHAVEQLPRVELSEDEVRRIGNGLRIERKAEDRGQNADNATAFAAVDAAGRLVGVLTAAGPSEWRSLRTFPRADA